MTTADMGMGAGMASGGTGTDAGMANGGMGKDGDTATAAWARAATGHGQRHGQRHGQPQRPRHKLTAGTVSCSLAFAYAGAESFESLAATGRYFGPVRVCQVVSVVDLREDDVRLGAGRCELRVRRDDGEVLEDVVYFESCIS